MLDFAQFIKRQGFILSIIRAQCLSHPGNVSSTMRATPILSETRDFNRKLETTSVSRGVKDLPA